MSFVIVIVPETTVRGLFVEVSDSEQTRVVGPFRSRKQAVKFAEEKLGIEIWESNRGSGSSNTQVMMNADPRPGSTPIPITTVWAYLHELRKDDALRWW